MPEQRPEEYNRVFEQLVDEADPAHELVGLVAYGLYKSAKREWVISAVRKEGRQPDRQQHSAHALTQTDVILDGYRAQADAIISSYATAFVERERPKIYEAALKGTFWRSFWSSFWASVAFAAAISLLVLIAAISGMSLPVEFSVGQP